MFLSALASRRWGEFSHGMMAGILIASAYSFASFCFVSERQRGTLQLLLALPMRPSEVVLAKYASLYSMALFLANVSGIFMGDLRVLFLLNVLVLWLSTLSMAATVICDEPWAAIVPLWVTLVFFMPIRKILEKFFPYSLDLYSFIASHLVLLAAIGLALLPFIAIASAIWFEKQFA